MAEHKTKRVVWGHQEADIDRDIAELILEIWKAELDTYNSCQNNVPKGYVWVEFASPEDAAVFLDIVSQPYDEDFSGLYHRIAGMWRPYDERGIKPWYYSIFPWDNGLIEEEQEDGSLSVSHCGQPDFEFHVSIRFPRTDLAELTRRMVKYNEEHSQMEVCPHCLKAHS